MLNRVKRQFREAKGVAMDKEQEQMLLCFYSHITLNNLKTVCSHMQGIADRLNSGNVAHHRAELSISAKEMSLIMDFLQAEIYSMVGCDMDMEQVNEMLIRAKQQQRTPEHHGIIGG